MPMHHGTQILYGTEMTDHVKFMHNEQVKLTANFLSKIGCICFVIGIVMPAFVPVTSGVLLFGTINIFVGIGLNLIGFWYIGKLH